MVDRPCTIPIMVCGDEARRRNECSRVARTALLLFLLFRCPVDTMSANNQPHDFSSLPPHIDTESASSKEPKNRSSAQRCQFVNSSEEVSMDYSDGATQHLVGVPALLRVRAALSPLCGGPETRCLPR